MKETRIRELFKTTGILLIARITTQLVSFLLIPLYTSILTTSEYGEIDIYTTLSMIVVPFMTLQLEMGLFRAFVVAKKDKIRSEIVTSTFMINGVVFIAFGFIYLAVVSFFVRLEYSSVVFLYYLLIAIDAVFLQLCRAEGKTLAYGVANFLLSSVAVGLNVLFVANFHWGVLGVLCSSIIAYALALVYMLWETQITSYFSVRLFSINRAKELLVYSFPLVFNQISSWLINYSDRLIILNFWGVATNGVYSLACKFSNITATLFGVYNIAWSENIIRNMEDADKDSYISKIINYTFSVYLEVISIIISIIAIAFTWFIKNKEYHDAYPHIPILLLAMFFSGMAAMLGSIYIATGKTKEVSITTTLAGLCNIIVHFALLKSYRLYAASISTLVSFALLLVYRIIFIRKSVKITYSVKSSIVNILVYIAAWAAYLIHCSFLSIGLIILDFYLLISKLRILKKEIL